MLVAAVCGWGRWRVTERDREEAIIGQLREAGSPSLRYIGPIWLHRLVGGRHLSFLYCVDDLDGPYNRGVTEDDATSVRKMCALAAGLRRGLRGICLRHPDDRAVTRLCSLSNNITRLDLFDGGLTERGFEAISNLSHLEQLTIWLSGEAPLTAAGMAHLQSLRELRSLTLNGISASDPGLREIAKLNGLERLSLSGFGITDAERKRVGEGLEGLPHLKSLRILVTNITDQGVTKLQRALPNCEVEIWDGMGERCPGGSPRLRRPSLAADPSQGIRTLARGASEGHAAARPAISVPRWRFGLMSLAYTGCHGHACVAMPNSCGK